MRRLLAQALGPAAAGFRSLATGSDFDAVTDAAARAWQAGKALVADGVIGPYCQQLLGMTKPGAMAVDLTVENVQHLFPATRGSNIRRNLPYVAAALDATGLRDSPMILAALGTIRAESEGFVPISEFPSRFNTLPGQPPFSQYEGRKTLGNNQPGDGARFRGRGFVQLSGRANYTEFGKQLGIDLAGNPELANAPEVAAVLLATFLASKAAAMRRALTLGNFASARKLVNGGSFGLDKFESVFTLAKSLPAPAAAPKAGAGATRGRMRASSRPLNASKDPVDIQDRLYTPPPTSLAACYPDDATVAAFLPRYTAAGLILDQGNEGACTGFGLACVINYLRWRIHKEPATFTSVSPRMLYNFARRYDEYAGENYEGSSCRGALKGWFHHGVCLATDWPYLAGKVTTPNLGYVERAADSTLGVYYRIDIKSITDLQAAIAQVGAIYVSANTHRGWQSVPTLKSHVNEHPDLPVIAFDGTPSTTDGHAFALVGFNTKGFVLQNSWSKQWGGGGFAVLSYGDWLANGMDAWVAAMGVPGVMQGQIVGDSKGGGGKRAGLDKSQWWDEATALEHSVIFKDDGRVDSYVTQDHLSINLQYQAAVLPDQWFRTAGARKKQRLVIYAHGGLNDQAAAITRAQAMGRYFIGNGCYPLFMVWKTGLWETLGAQFGNLFSPNEGPAAAGRWTDATDLVIERGPGRLAGKPIWSDMKTKALDCSLPTRGMEQLAGAIASLATTWPKLEVHVIGHSAGSIFLGYLLDLLAQRRLDGHVASAHLYAPACTVAFANQYYATHDALMHNLYIDLLSDRNELDDTVGPYRKSLLYLVSNALETDVHTPILGLANVMDASYTQWDGTSVTDAALRAWRRAADDTGLADRTRPVIAPTVPTRRGKVIPASHGSFDNNTTVVGRSISRIIGADLSMPVDDLEGY
ncbi:C1 family peptidase [Pinirhizobacter sp.]|uniref:C1 family peptidase n=1 Tax=Pinirhizobacter sp. TaxID=2950432 RepID=UPI002F40C4F3